MSETAGLYRVRAVEGLPALSEKRWQAQVIQVAQLFAWCVYHTFDSRRSAPGFPDLVLARQGRVLFAELKTDRGKLRPEQRHWLATLAQCGGNVEVYVWRPGQVDDVVAILRGDAGARERARAALLRELG